MAEPQATLAFWAGFSENEVNVRSRDALFVQEPWGFAAKFHEHKAIQGVLVGLNAAATKVSIELEHLHQLLLCHCNRAAQNCFILFSVFLCHDTFGLLNRRWTSQLGQFIHLLFELNPQCVSLNSVWADFIDPFLRNQKVLHHFGCHMKCPLTSKACSSRFRAATSGVSLTERARLGTRGGAGL